MVASHPLMENARSENFWISVNNTMILNKSLVSKTFASKVFQFKMFCVQGWHNLKRMNATPTPWRMEKSREFLLAV